MLFITTGILGQLAKSLLNGEANFVEELVEKKVADLGKDLIADLISASPIGTGIKIAKMVEGGGANEFKRMRDAWLNSLQPTAPHSGLLGRIGNDFQKQFVGASQSQMAPEGPGKWTWSKSRQEWLDESWKHDWRSQPRDSKGRWIKGRLNSIYVSASARKKRNRNRRIIRKRVREIMRGN